MRRTTFFLMILTAFISISVHSQTRIRVFDTTLFYDGYNRIDTLVNKGQMTAIAPNGVTRLSTSLHTKQLPDSILALIGDSLAVKILVKAKCDNYDRIGQIGLAFVPKSKSTYTTSDSSVKRIELARFITPFMNKNLKPDTVPYFFRIDNITSILREKKILDTFNIWFEVGIFGVPYAANTQVAGCSGRNDVFYATVDLYTNNSASIENDNVFIPISNQFYMNNYKVGASDTLTISEKTFKFTLANETKNCFLNLITSNHGAGSGGEEYNRRMHYIYVDNNLVMQYTPGDTSCEPYRKFNTQGNGIYGSTPMTNAQWQSFSNWCPGSRIPIRIIDLGTMAKGQHAIKISVPDAVFNLKDGYFPISLYFQGKYKASNMSTTPTLHQSITIFPNPAHSEINIKSDETITDVAIYDAQGKKVGTSKNKTIDVSSLAPGKYIVKISLKNGEDVIRNFVK